MTIQYKYRPPLTLLLIGIPTVFLSVIFGFMVFEISSWERIVIMLVGVFFLLYGSLQISKYIMNLDIDNLEIGEDFIKLPINNKESVILNINQIEESFEIKFPEASLAIKTKHSIYLVKKPWMSRKDFNSVKNKIKNYPQQWL